LSWSFSINGLQYLYFFLPFISVFVTCCSLPASAAARLRMHSGRTTPYLTINDHQVKITDFTPSPLNNHK